MSVSIGGARVTGTKSELEEDALRRILAAQEQAKQSKQQGEREKEAMRKMMEAQQNLDRQKTRATQVRSEAGEGVFRVIGRCC